MLDGIMIDAKKRDLVFQSAVDCCMMEQNRQVKLIGLKIITALVDDYYEFMENYFRVIFKVE